MATSNFGRPQNASHIYAICMSYEDDETGETISPDYQDCIEEREQLKDQIKELFPNEINYDGNEIYSFRVTKIINNREIEIAYSIIVESGYYEGAQIDWLINGYVDGYDFDYENGELSLDYVSDQLELKGTKTLEKGINTLIKQTNKKLDELLLKITTPLGVTARFSNGETMYHKVV